MGSNLAAARDDVRSARPAHLSTLRQFFVSCFWFAFSVQWGAMLAIVLPSQIAVVVGEHRKELFNGIIPPLGAVFALVLSPVVGALSDRSSSRFGKRRPYMLVGTLINVAFMLWLARFGAGDSAWFYLLAYLGVQFGSNWAAGPYAGLIPDVVPREQRGAASGWMALMSSLGTLVGALAAGQLVRGGDYVAIDLLIVGALVVMLAVTLVGVREQPGPPPAEPFRLGAFLRSFILSPTRYRDFYWVLITRALVTMGIYSVFTFFQYFMKDVIRVPDPERQASYLIGIIIAGGIVTSLIAGRLSDRFGRKPLVYVSGGMMAFAAIVFIAVAFFPSIQFMFAVGALFGLGYGAYQAVDWALAIDVLPAGDSAAKDMGIWHVAIVLPQVLAPALTGLTLTTFKSVSLLLGYNVVFVLTALWFVLGTVFVRQIRGAR
jgi:Na+/melibiose symporter-like transporter